MMQILDYIFRNHDIIHTITKLRASSSWLPEQYLLLFCSISKSHSEDDVKVRAFTSATHLVYVKEQYVTHVWRIIVFEEFWKGRLVRVCGCVVYGL